MVCAAEPTCEQGEYQALHTPPLFPHFLARLLYFCYLEFLIVLAEAQAFGIHVFQEL